MSTVPGGDNSQFEGRGSPVGSLARPSPRLCTQTEAHPPASRVVCGHKDRSPFPRRARSCRCAHGCTSNSCFRSLVGEWGVGSELPSSTCFLHTSPITSLGQAAQSNTSTSCFWPAVRVDRVEVRTVGVTGTFRVSAPCRGPNKKKSSVRWCGEEGEIHWQKEKWEVRSRALGGAQITQTSQKKRKRKYALECS